MSGAAQKPIRKLVTLDEATARRVDDFRFGQRISRESDALRKLIQIALDAFDARDAKVRTPHD